MSATTLQRHGRSIAGGHSAVTQHQGTSCGELVSTADESEPGDSEEGLTEIYQMGLALALLILLIGGAAALGGA